MKHRDEKDSIYLILEYPDMREIRDLLFDIRLLLLYRSRIITRMKRDFNNNLFQSLWQTQRHNLLLEHFKNVSHMNPGESNTMDKIMEDIWRISDFCKKSNKIEDIQQGLRIYKSMILKILADNNISSIYHEILSKKLLANEVQIEEFSTGGFFDDIWGLRGIFNQEREYGNNEEWIEAENPPALLIIDEDVLQGHIFYITPYSYRSHLAVISMIQNAYKHGDNKKEVHIYRESGKQYGEIIMDYLCIANAINLDNVELIKRRIEEHVRKPVASRKIEGDNQKCEGITLFSINRYCQKIIEVLQKNECKDILLKYEVQEDKIIFKIPILKGDK